MSTAAELRERASQLRRLAHLLESCPIVRLESLGGFSTWRGPTASSFADDQWVGRRAVASGCTSLRVAARRLADQADQVELAAAAGSTARLGAS